MRNVIASKISNEGSIDFIASIRECNRDSPMSITLFPEMNDRGNYGEFSTKYVSTESLNLMVSQETNNGKDAICKKEEQLVKSIMSFTQPPAYRSLIMDIINNPPPDYTVVTGIGINVSSGIFSS